MSHFELCLMCQNHDSTQHFVQCMIDCEEKAKTVLDSMESSNFDMYELIFRLV